MKYNTSVITYFVIPSGATSGQRIVLDGATGQINLFNATNELVGQWTPSAFIVQGGTPAVGQSIQILPNAGDDFSRTAIEFRQAVGGGAAIIDTNNDGAGNPQLNAFGPLVNNSAGVPVTWSAQLHNAFAELVGIEGAGGAHPGALHGGSVLCQDAGVTLACYATSGAQTQQNSLVLAGGASPIIKATPDASRSGVGVTPTLDIVYNTRITSAIAQIDGVGVWVLLAISGGYTNGTPAPAITLLPDGTLAFRGVLTTRAAPVSGDTCMQSPTNLTPTAVRALLVFTLTNPNTVLQLNWNTNGSFQLFGGGPNPPGNTGVSLDSIPPVPVAF